MRFFILLIALALLNYYAASRILDQWPWAQENLFAAWSGVFVIYVLQVTSPFIGQRYFSTLKPPEGFAFAVNWLSYTAFGLMSMLIFYALVADIVGLAWKGFDTSTDPNHIDYWTWLALVAVTTVSAVVGSAQAHMAPAVIRVDIPLKNLPPAFDGFTIAQISDLHVGPTIRKAYAEKVVSITNGLKPDAIALTGDFVDGTVPDLAPHVAPLAQLQAADGVFFVTGNHEYYWDADAWVGEFKRLGISVLTNEHKVIRRDGGALTIAGITDFYTTRSRRYDASSPEKALAGAPADAPKILLAHQPASYLAAEAAGADLQISGHAHGGQYFPYSLFIRFFQKFYRGLGRHKNMWIYVNRGTGYWGPPLRFGVPSEITLITLRRGE